MINRFKEFRRTPKSIIPKTTHQARPVKSCSPGGTIQPPVTPPGEDQTSFDRHNREIKAQFRRKGPVNSVVVAELIKSSYAMRRKDILDNNYHVQIILQKYSFYKEANQVGMCNLYF